MMNEKKIKQVLGELGDMFKSEKAKSFAVHMIQSFGQLNTVSKVQNVEELKEGAKCRCALCNKKVLTVVESIDLLKFTPNDEVKNTIIKDIESEDMRTLPELKEFAYVKLAYKSFKSNRVLCEDCISALATFIAAEINNGNVEMVKVTAPKERKPKLEKIPRKETTDVANDRFSKYQGDKPKGKRVIKPRKENKGQQILSGNEALLALKAQLEGNN